MASLYVSLSSCCALWHRYVGKLRTELEESAWRYFHAPAERDRIRSVLVDLSQTALAVHPDHPQGPGTAQQWCCSPAEVSWMLLLHIFVGWPLPAVTSELAIPGSAQMVGSAVLPPAMG